MSPYKYIATLDTPRAEDLYRPEGITSFPVGNQFNLDSFNAGWKGDVHILRTERAEMVRAITDAGIPLLVLPQLLSTFKRANGMSEAIEYVRDPVSVSRDGRMLLFKMSAETRRMEPQIHALFAEALGLKAVHAQAGLNEGGNSRVLNIKGEPWIFASTSVRSDLNGLTEQADFLGIPETNRIFLELTDGFHFDCAFMPVVDGNETLHVASSMDAFSDKSRQTIERTVSDLEGELHELDSTDVELMAPNQLFTGSHIFRTEPFVNQSLEARWTSLPGIGVSTFPLTQNRRTGGQVHCLTQEVYVPEPLDPQSIRAALSRHSDVFGDNPEVKIFNNY
ncbi:MAG: hypothetical protein WC777_06300 [Candidatus Gracilibacteria bacterium]|jgi:N-dimethylarginine dimethylaminohydrolase